MNALETVIVLGLAAALVGCAATNDGPSAPRCRLTDQVVEGRATASMISLSESLEPLRERFNAAKGKNRFIAILSPT